MTLVEEVARVLEPLAWAALGTCDTFAYKNRRASSLRMADSIRSLIHDRLKEPTPEMVVAMHGTGMGPYKRIWAAASRRLSPCQSRCKGTVMREYVKL